MCATCLAGCAMSLPMTSLWERRGTQAPAAASVASQPTEPATTGSVRRPLDLAAQAAAPAPSLPGQPLPAGDWSMAERALREALSDRAETPSVSWDNPASGMRGTVTALQRATAADGQVCRAFLGSGIRERSETWFEGRACRKVAGDWEIGEIRPWRRG